MIPELIAIAIALALGLALALMLDRSARGSAAIGEGLLLGTGATAAILFVYAVAGVRWSAALLIATAMIATAVCWWFARDRASAVRQVRPYAWGALPFDVFSVAALTGYTLLATIAPVWEFDYLGDWGLKGRLFWEIRGIDWSFLEQAFHRAVHADYPILLPLSFDVFAVIRGAWNDQLLGLLNVVFAVGLLLIVRRLAAEESGSAIAPAFIVAAMVPFAASPWMGLGESPLAAFGTAAILLLRADDSRINVSAVLLGLAASSKNEGLTLIVAVVVGLIVAGRARLIPRLWPAVAIPLPWLVLRAVHDLPTDLATGSVFSRVAVHIEHPQMLLGALAQNPVGKPLYWIGIMVAIAVLRSEFVSRERFALTAIVVQFAFYIGAYLSSPHDLDWHLRWSWERVVSHLTPTLTYIALVQLVRVIDASGREAKPALIPGSTVSP